MTTARAIYKRMEIGKEYSTQELVELASTIELLPMEEHQDLKKAVVASLWKMVNTGYATTEKRDVELWWVRGKKFGSAPNAHQVYTMRFWRRVK